MNTFNTILQDALLLFQLLPQVLTMITQVEAIVGAGNGSLKKDIVMTPVAAFSPGVQTGVSQFIDKTVQRMNTAGKFVKTVQAVQQQAEKAA